MDVGLLSLGDLLTDPVTGVRRSHGERHRNLVEQAVAAEAVGFTSVHLGEHHFCDYILSAPPVVLAAIAERTSTLRLSTGVALGVNLDPIRIYGHPTSGKRIGCCTHTYIHESSQKARQIWEPRYRAYIEWVNDLQARSSGGEMQGLGGFNFDTLIVNTAMCGSPEEVVDRIGTIKETLHLDTQILMFDMGGLPDTELFDVIELAGKSVLPAVAAF